MTKSVELARSFDWYRFTMPPVTTAAVQRREIIAWCLAEFGPEDDERWWCMMGPIWFRRPEDALHFKMRWA